ncbi:MAG: hypothetical protein WCC18_11505, partial [Candidatus Acidiferrales bacterium]
MKRFRNSRDDGRFALNTLQNPNLEVRSLHQLIAAAEQALAEDAARQSERPISDVPSSNEVPPPKNSSVQKLRPQVTHSLRQLCPKTPNPRPKHLSNPPNHQSLN